MKEGLRVPRKFLSILSCLTGLTIFAGSSVYAQNTLSDSKEQSPEVKRDAPLQERPDTLPDNKKRDPGTTDTAHPEIGGDITRPVSRDDVVRDIFSHRPSGQPGGPGHPVPELPPPGR
jgi:hypothetical protein